MTHTPDLIYGESVFDECGPVTSIRAMTEKGKEWLDGNGGTNGLYMIESDYFVIVRHCAERDGLALKRG